MATKYRYLAERLEVLIQKNIQNGIHKLPTEQELCRRYRVSRQTVRMALSLLEQQGLIEKRQGSGSYITGRLGKANGNVIGVLISSDQEYIYPNVLNDIRSTLARHDFSMEIFVTDNCLQKEKAILQQLLKEPLRGLIVEGCKSALPNPNLDLYRQLRKKNCPVVFLYNYYPALTDSLYVKEDNYYGSSLLVQHLVSQGHKIIGGIFKFDDMQGIERYQGMIETLNTLDLPFSDTQFGWYGSRETNLLLHDKNSRFLKNMIQEILSDCTAIICYNDLIAYYLIDELLASGYSLPGDITVASFDDTYLSSSGNRIITTLTHTSDKMGTLAAQTIIRKLSGLPVTSQETRWQLNGKQ